MEAPISSSLGAMGSLLGKLDELLRTAHRALSIKQLRNDLGVINTRLVELSKLNAPSLTAKYWMKDVRELSYDMDDCVDQFVHADADAKMDWIEKISGFKTRVEEANERHDRYKLDCALSSTNKEVDHRLPTVDAKAAIDPVGIDGPMSELDRLLTDGEQQLRVVSIVGVGGVGKSTLAQKIFCKQGEQFECLAFVQMAKKPDVRRILRSMLSQVRPHQPPEACEVHNLIHDLRKHLQDKRYFIIVDDLWATSAWDIVSRAFPEGNRGSRIVTTTKFEDVALACCGYKSKYIFKMKPLSDHDSKKIFNSVVFGSGKGCPQQFSDVSDEITRKCGGLPLALISIANILAIQPATIEHWEYVQNFMSNNLRTNPTFDEILNQVLDLCYNSLSHCLKTCLLYLGVYPENHTIKKEDLVKQWVAEGFICATKGKNIMEVAGSYFEKFVNLRLIQCIYINNNDKVLSYVVHHMVLDLITYKSIEENFITIMDYSHMTVGLSDKVRRLSLHFGSATYATTPTGIGLSHVRSLVFLGLLNCMPSIVEFKLLRVLILHFLDDDGNKSFDLRGMCELFRLTYLQITCNVTVKLPDQMQWLKHLETLEINARAVAVPSDIVHLSSLLHLRLRGERNLPAMIGNSKSVTLDPGASGTAISLNDTTIVPTSPVFLQTFELLPPICILSRLPEWMGQLRKLCILKIVVRELLSNDIDILSGLPELTVLSLYVRQPTAERIVFNRGTFPLLKCSKFWCGVLFLAFQEEAMPNLRRLKLGFNAHRGELYGNMLAGIEHLLNLQEIDGRIGAAAGAEESDLRAAESAFKEAVCKHSRLTSFDIRRVDWVDEELDEMDITESPVERGVGDSSVEQPSGEACEGSNASPTPLSVSGKDSPNHQQLAKESQKVQFITSDGRTVRKDIAGQIGVATGADESDRRAAESAFKDAISKHPGRPRFNVQWVDSVDEEYRPVEKEHWRQEKGSSGEQLGVLVNDSAEDTTKHADSGLHETDITECPVGRGVGNSSVEQPPFLGNSSAMEYATGEEENSMFETSHVLGALLASSPLLGRAWDRCVAATTAADTSGFVHGGGGTVYVAFSGVQAALSVAGAAVARGADAFAPVGLGEDAAGRLFAPLVGAEPEVAVQALALQWFLKLYGSPEFQMLLNQIRGKAVVFTGHSLGGTIAALTALHYLCISSSSSTCAPAPPVLCVTFGSPLLGNEALSKAILRERWGGNFCHVVSQYDVVPRLLFCPLDAVPTHVIVGMQLHQWPAHARHAGAVTALMADTDQEALRQLIQTHADAVVMEQKLAAADTQGESPYRPFGTLRAVLPGWRCVRRQPDRRGPDALRHVRGPVRAGRRGVPGGRALLLRRPRAENAAALAPQAAPTLRQRRRPGRVQLRCRHLPRAGGFRHQQRGDGGGDSAALAEDVEAGGPEIEPELREPRDASGADHAVPGADRVVQGVVRLRHGVLRRVQAAAFAQEVQQGQHVPHQAGPVLGRRARHVRHQPAPPRLPPTFQVGQRRPLLPAPRRAARHR